MMKPSGGNVGRAVWYPLRAHPQKGVESLGATFDRLLLFGYFDNITGDITPIRFFNTFGPTPTVSTATSYNDARPWPAYAKVFVSLDDPNASASGIRIRPISIGSNESRETDNWSYGGFGLSWTPLMLFVV